MRDCLAQYKYAVHTNNLDYNMERHFSQFHNANECQWQELTVIVKRKPDGPVIVGKTDFPVYLQNDC